jgi:hypothetical protein
MSMNDFRPPEYTLPIERSPIEAPISIGGGEFGAGPYGGSPYGGSPYGGGGFPSFDGVGGSSQWPYGAQSPNRGAQSPYGSGWSGQSYGAGGDGGASAGGVLQPLINFMSGLVGQIGSFLGGGFTGGS